MADQTHILKHILARHGLSEGKVAPIQSGLFNESFLIERPGAGRRWDFDSNRIVVRIAPPDQRGMLFYERRMMRQEPEVHRLVQKNTDIPLPEIYCFDQSRSVVDRDYMLMQWMPGKVMSEANLSYGARNRAYEQTGQFLASLHSGVCSTQYGYRGAHGCMEPQNTWREAFEIMWKKLAEDIHTCGVYTADEFKRVLSAFDAHADVFHFEPCASLLHMDIWSQNILVDNDGSVTAILDWDRALWGDPGIEIAVLEYCGFDTEAFKTGYGEIPATGVGLEKRQMFYHLYEVQKYLVIWTARRKGRAADIRQYKSYCLQMVADLM